MISEQISKITDTNGRVGYLNPNAVGFLVTFDGNGNISVIYTCRDQFLAGTTEKTDVAGFLSPGVDIQVLNNFFEEIETKLNLSEKVIFHASTIPNLIVVEIPNFWREHIARRSLFSLFLRAGAIYYKTSFENAIESYPLANSIKPAIDFFLDGNIFPTFTKWKPNGNGFVTEFSGITSKEELNKKLNCFQIKSADYFMTQ